MIGPVRSARPYLVEIGDGFDGLIVHAGWSQEAKNLLVQRRIQHFDAVYGDHDFFWRSSERVAPHNLYTSMEKIWEGAEKRNYRIGEWSDPGILFVDETEGTSSLDKAESVHIPYIGGYYVSYEWDAEEGHYTRSMIGEEHVDKESGNVLVAHNILVLKSDHRIVDNAGRRHIDVNGPGNGYLVQSATYQEVIWRRVNGLIRVFDDQGNELPWVPGKTWVHIVPHSSEISFE